jgi:hypothetical protein
MVLVKYGKYKGRSIYELLHDRRYVDWVMTTSAQEGSLVSMIRDTVEREKGLLKQAHRGQQTPEFVREWLNMSYEGYSVKPEDLEWVQSLLATESTSISVSFASVGYVFMLNKTPCSIPFAKPCTPDTILYALRNEIQEQLSYYRSRQFHNRHTWTCEETGIDLTNTADTHVDHHFRKKTFLDLVRGFFPEYTSLDILWFGSFYQLNNRTLAKEWSDYHQEHAVLRLIHKSANINFLTKYPEGPPFAPKQKQKKPEPLPQPKLKSFDSFFASLSPEQEAEKPTSF